MSEYVSRSGPGSAWGASSVVPYVFDRTITTANDGEDALQLFDDDSTFDLIVSDLMMPGMSGAQLGRPPPRARARRSRSVHVGLSPWDADAWS
jgi:CheY-like chemotaxis protein